MALNSIQSSFEELKVDDNPKEVIEQFYDFFNNIPFIQNLTKSDRKRAKDLPRDTEGKIEVNITEPHILEDMDYFRPSAIHFQKYGCFTKLRPNPNPSSEYGKWIRNEIKRCWYGYIRPSDGEWVTGDYYYYLNYCPIQLIKKLPNGQSVRTVDFPRVWDGQYLVHHYLYNARLHGHHASELASRGKGKAHPYDEIVYTPEGKKKWKDIKIGDFLFGDDGSLTQVTDIPFDDKAPIYEVELSSGHKIRCSEGHLWKVNSHCRGNIIISTKELLGLYKRPHKISLHNPKGYELDCTIPKGEGAEFPYIQTKVDPYTFGLLLGDGSFRNPGYKNAVYFTAEDKDFAVYKTFIPYTINKVPSGKYSYSIKINGIYDILDIYGLSQKKSEDKFIPDEYKYNSKAVRVAILKGLLDADGTVSNGKIELVLSSKRMIKDVRWICASLGIPCTDIRIKKTWYYGENREKVECLDAYRLSIFSDINLFNLPRKISQWSSRSKTAYAQSKYKGYKITNITYIGEQQAKCITVDNESHCYLINEFIVTHNSFMGAGLLAKRFKLGESEGVNKKVMSAVTASDKKYIWGPNQILNMFKYYIDFQSQHTQFPRQLLTDSAQLLMWESGFKDKDTGVRKGTQNAVIGVTTGVNQDKLNGSRGVLYLIEEAGIFSNLNSLYQMIRPSVEDGKDVYGLIFMYGTAGDDMSDFTSLQEIMYNPDGYNMEKNLNVWDKEGQGRKWFTFFYPAYMNRANCMDENGNSNVTKALLEICQDRYVVKYNSTDINAITKRISQYPITPQEAIIRAHSTIFPITELNERLNQIDNNPNFYNDTYVGNLVFNGDGEVEFVISNDKPIRDFPTKDNKIAGAIEIFALPEKDSNGKIPNERYIAGADPYDDDASNTMSLGSFFVLDTWTDTLVMEYTGRPPFANDYFEICRKGCLFYNAKLMYENNKKGLFSYFSMMNSSYLLANTPEYLKDKQLIKDIGYGNKACGINATTNIKGFGFQKIRDWLLTPYTKIEKDQEGHEIEVSQANLYRIKNRALLKELILWNPNINVDRIMAMVQLILYREEKMVLYGGNMSSSGQDSGSELADDPFFTQNYDARYIQ